MAGIMEEKTIAGPALASSDDSFSIMRPGGFHVKKGFGTPQCLIEKDTERGETGVAG
jgi:hypothetical protein